MYVCYICKENFENKYVIDKKKQRKVRHYCSYTGELKGATHSTLNLKWSVPKKNPIAFRNESNYDYHFITKELAEEYEKQTASI